MCTKVIVKYLLKGQIETKMTMCKKRVRKEKIRIEFKVILMHENLYIANAT